MEKFNSIDDVLDYAIDQEQEAVDFYTELAKNARSNDTKANFMEFVKEEMGHKEKLMKLKQEGSLSIIEDKAVQDLKISDYLSPVTPSPDMSYQEALIVVMKKEKAAYNLYLALEKMVPSPELKEVFHLLALQEANHKLQFEEEYDDIILKDN